MRCCLLVTVVCLLAAAQLAFSSVPSDDQQTLWNLEHAYWQYVEKNDLGGYSNLWHEDFLGWPSVSSAPVRKDHITDWITSQTSKGLAFKAGEFKPAGIQVTGDVAFACYWVTTSSSSPARASSRYGQVGFALASSSTPPPRWAGYS